MTNKGSQQLREYRQELKSIINQLETIEYDVRHNFKNVGNERCADSIKSVINKYKSTLRTLNSVDASLLDTLLDAAQNATNSK